MPAFVSVIIGILFCTTFWDRPRAFAFSYMRRRCDRRVLSFKENVLKNEDAAQACNAGIWENLDSIVAKEVKRAEDAVNTWIYVTYTVSALICGSLGLLELAGSWVQYIGLWNLCLLLPIFLHLSLSLLAYRRMGRELSRAERDYKGYIRVQIDDAQRSSAKNARDVGNMVPPVPVSGESGHT